MGNLVSILRSIKTNLFDHHDIAEILTQQHGPRDWVEEHEINEQARIILNRAKYRKWAVYRTKYRKWELTSRFYLSQAH